MKKINRILTLLLAAVLLISLAACGSDDDDETEETETDAPETEETETPEETDDGSDEAETAQTSDDGPQYGGSITIYTSEFLNNFDPSVADNANYTYWYECLWALDWGLDDSDTFAFDTAYITNEYLTGRLADTWELDEDAATFTVNLREDVYFQDKAPYDGRQLVAEDVKWSYDRLLGTGSGWDEPIQCESDWVSLLYMIDSIDTDGDFTVVFNLKSEYVTETAVNDLMINDVNIAGPEWDELTEEEQSDWRYATGTGPYILEEYVLDSSMRFVRNDNYYGYDERYPENKLPYLDEVTLLVITESANRMTQFVSGSLDFLVGSGTLSASEMEQLRATLDEDEYTEYVNYTAAPGIGLKQTHEALQDIRVREALQYAINCDEIHYNYFGYTTDPSPMGLFHTGTDYSTVDQWDDELLDSYTTYDPDLARELLAEAGYDDGFEFSVILFTGMDQDLYTLAASYLAEVGVTMNIEVASSGPEMMQIGLSEDNTTSMVFTGGLLEIRSVINAMCEGGASYCLFHGDTYFEDMISDMNTATSMEERLALGNEADEYYAEQHWVLNLGYGEQGHDFVSSRVNGYNNERLSVRYNMRSVVARVWVDDAE